MKKINSSLIFFIIYSFSLFSFADEVTELEITIEESPQLLLRLVDVKNPLTEFAVKSFQRTDLIQNASFYDLNYKEGQCYLSNQKVIFESPENSLKEVVNSKDRIGKWPAQIYKWNIEVSEEDDYFICTSLPVNTRGLLGDRNIVCDKWGNLLLENGQNFIHLEPDKYSLTLIVEAMQGGKITIVKKSELVSLVKNIIERMQGENGKEYFVEKFFPTIVYYTDPLGANALNAMETFFVKFKNTFSSADEDKMASMFWSSRFEYSTELYFTLESCSPGMIFNYFKHKNGFNDFRRGSANLIRAFYYSGLTAEANKFCQKVLEVSKEVNPKEQIAFKLEVLSEQASAFYSLSYFGKLGAIFNEMKDLIPTEKKAAIRGVGDTLYRLLYAYLSDAFEEPHKVMMTDNLAETLSFEIMDTIRSYKGEQEYLEKAWRWLESLDDKLVLNDNKIGASLMGKLLVGLADNESFALAFRKYGIEKLESRVQNLLQENDYKKQEQLFYKFGSLVDLENIKRSLFHQYKLKGDFAKATFYGESLKQKKQLNDEEKKVFDDILRASGIGDLKMDSNFVFNLGSVSGHVTLPYYHLQYSRHNLYDFVQSAEVYKNKKSIFINSASDTIVLDAKTKKEVWHKKFDLEYHQIEESGPYQKRFPINFFGNQLTVYGPTIDADDKSVLCFKNDGTFLWDSAQFSEQALLEPICNSFYSAGKLFTFTITKNDTIQIIYLTTVDPLTGKYLSSIPISKVSRSIRNSSGYTNRLDWNTYRHDEHFVSDGEFLFAYTGTGVTLKIDPISNGIVWAHGYNRLSNVGHNSSHIDSSGASSGFIGVKEGSVISIMPDIRMIIGFDSVSGKENWKSVFNYPHLIHSRGNNEHFIFSKNGFGKEAFVSSLDFKTGKELWRSNLHGLVPTGEGQTVGAFVALPVQNGICVLQAKDGKLVKHLSTQITFDKIRILGGQIVLFSKNNVWFVNNDGEFNQSDFQYKVENKRSFIEPDVQPSARLMMDNLDVESTIPLFEKILSGSSSWRSTNYFKTSKPFYHLINADECLVLFNEGFTNSNNDYVPPSVIWQEMLPSYKIFGDRILISKPGVLSFEDLFTRKVLWTYQYSIGAILAEKLVDIQVPLVGTDGKFIALQLADGNVRILDAETRKVLFHIPFEDVSRLELSDGVLVLQDGRSATAYDLKDWGALLWTKQCGDKAGIYAEDGMFVCSYYHPSYTSVFFDIKTGKEKFKIKSHSGGSYGTDKWELRGEFVYMYGNLYHRDSGELVKGSKEAVPVKNGGYLCFNGVDGNEGFYYEGNKKYAFKLNENRSKYNRYIAAMKKGDEIYVVCPSFSQRYKIVRDKLEVVAFIDSQFAKYGAHGFQRGMSYYPLDDSFMIIRYNEISFVREFRKDEVLNTFHSFQVRDDVDWPKSESYPEIEIPLENWISSPKVKPDSQISYQIGVNSDYVFMKFRINKVNDLVVGNISHQLKIRSSQGPNISYLYWDYDKWENAQASAGLGAFVSSWKQIDTHGNAILFLKMKHSSGPLASRNFNNIGPLGIEFSLLNNGSQIGFYRIGGATLKHLNPFPWKMRYNYHAKQLNNVVIRENLYDRLNSIYPQGQEISAWLASRRKIFGADGNVKWLTGAVERYKNSFAVINFISALAYEKIIAKKCNIENSDSESYKDKIKLVLSEVNKFCTDRNINKEWVNSALTVLTIEVYPSQRIVEKWSRIYDLATTGTAIYYNDSKIFTESFEDVGAVFEAPLYTPHLVYFLPGLLSGYPAVGKDKKSEIKFVLEDVNSGKSKFGEANLFKVGVNKAVISKDGKVNGVEIAMGKGAVEVVEGLYNWKSRKIPVYFFGNNGSPDRLVLTIKDFKLPEFDAIQELTEETIQISLDNLPPDSGVGYKLIDVYRRLKKNEGEEDLNKLKGMLSAWMKIICKETEPAITASRQIYESIGSADKLGYLKDVWKEARVPVMSQRIYFLRYNNLYLSKGSFSFMGPLENELKDPPTAESDFGKTFISEDGLETIKFENVKRKDRGRLAFWGSKITVKKNRKVTLLFTGSGPMRNCTVNIWLGDKQIVKNETPSSFSRGVLSQVFTLEGGENKLLIRIDAAGNYSWNNFCLLIGDHNGAPASDIKFEPLPAVK